MSGFQPSLQTVEIIGALMFVLLLVQIALGMRWIRLRGRTHWKVHKRLAWSIVAIAVVHVVLALAATGALSPE